MSEQVLGLPINVSSPHNADFDGDALISMVQYYTNNQNSTIIGSIRLTTRQPPRGSPHDADFDGDEKMGSISGG